VEARLIVPRLNIVSDISFLIDTGAESSVLMPSDCVRIGLDYNQLTGSVETVGIGGVSLDYIEPAVIAFTEPKQAVYGYALNLRISTYSQEIIDLPSLLGGDIIRRWRINYHPTKNQLHIHVISADLKLPIT